MELPKPPCFTEQCAWADMVGVISPKTNIDMCNDVASKIVAANVSGMFEVSPCPITAVLSLEPHEQDAPAQIEAKQEVWHRIFGTT